MKKDIIAKDFQEASDALAAFMADPKSFEAIEKAGALLAEAFKKGNKAVACGNGGSMADAMHFAEELTGRFRGDRPSLAAIAISDPTHLSCVSNDYGYDQVFSRFVEGVGREGDVLLAISTSGNSKSVVNAVDAAKKKGMKVIGLTGKNGGQVGPLCDVEIRAPQSAYADRAQEIHIKVIHTLIHLVEESL